VEAQLGPRCLLYPFAFVWIIKSRESRLDFGGEEVEIPGIIDWLDESVVGGRMNRLSQNSWNFGGDSLDSTTWFIVARSNTEEDAISGDDGGIEIKSYLLKLLLSV
jgi:hypothetical protein